MTTYQKTTIIFLSVKKLYIESNFIWTTKVIRHKKVQNSTATNLLEPHIT